MTLNIDETQHEAWNDRMARLYNPDAFITKSGFLIRVVEASRIRVTNKMLDIGPHDHVLDLGCGPGNLLEKLNGERVVGVDLSDSLLELARERTKNLPHVRVVKGNAEKLDFPDNTFDRVVCSEVLEHTRNPDVVLNEMARVTKPGGRVVITVPNETLINLTKRTVLLFRLKKFIAGGYDMSDNMLEEWHLNEITGEWVTKNAEKSFRLEKKRGVPLFPFAYHWIYSFVKKIQS